MRKNFKRSLPIVKIQEESVQDDADTKKIELKIQEIQPQSDEQTQKKTENTLSLLTKNFIKLIKSKQNMTIDSNQAANQLGIQKRRIYDITNVLQGIGYVQKVHKNKLRWVGGAKDPKISCQIESLDLQIAHYQKQQFELTSKIQYLQKRIKNDFMEAKQYNYIRLSYMKEILNNLPYKPSTAVIVKAPKDATLTSNQNEQTGLVQVEVAFGNQAKGSVYFVKIDNKTPKIQQKIIKTLPQKKVKVENQ